MTDRDTGRSPLPLDEAAAYLGLPAEAVEALVAGQFLPTAGPNDLEFRLVDLKAFLARNADYGSGNLLHLEADDPDPQALLEDLDARSDEMANRAFEIFAAVVSEARQWTAEERGRFVAQAKSRFEAILAVTGQGAQVDQALVHDLEEVGAAAAWSGSPLPQLLVVLRISRDLVVQTAVELAEERGGRWGLALSLLLTRVLPAMDRMIDALAQGYWGAVVAREEEASARYEHVVEHSSDGIWEADLDGRISYVNAAFGVIVGLDPEELDGVALTDLFPSPSSGVTLDVLTPTGASEGEPFEVSVRRPDGVRRVLAVRVQPRMVEDQVVGFQGVARDTTALHDLEAEKNEFLALVTHDIRTPLSTIVGMGATLETHSDELSPDRISRMGEAVRRQAERISRLADDLYDVSRLEASSLLLSVRPVDLAQVVEAALDTVDPYRDVASQVQLSIAPGIEVMADPRRLEQVVANLVANSFEHGAPPVTISVISDSNSGEVTFAVRDTGPGVGPAVEPVLFSRVHTLTRNHNAARVGLGTGLGLFLVRGLVQAMGGRVVYQPGEPGASFLVTLLAPRRKVDALTL